jgi:hypothetical protein
MTIEARKGPAQNSCHKLFTTVPRTLPYSAAGMKEAQQVVQQVLSNIIRGKFNPPALLASQRKLKNAAQPQGDANLIDAPVVLHFCDLLNITACGPTVQLSSEGKSMMVTVYNPLGWSRAEVVRVPVNTTKVCSWAITGALHMGTCSF